MYAHAVINIPDVDGTVFAYGQIVAPIDLAVVVAETAPLGKNFSSEIELQKLAAIRRRGLEVAAVNDVEKIVRTDGKRPRAAKLR